MDNLEKIITELPKHRLSPRADLMIRFRLKRLMLLSYLKRNFKLAPGQMTWHKAFAAGLAIFIFFLATSVYAYASDKILPGDRIYPLKRAVEKIEETVAPGAVKIKVYEKHSSRRLQEARDLGEQTSAEVKADPKVKQEKSENIKKNIESAVKKQEAIVEKINKLEDYDKAVKTIDKAKQADKKKTEYLGQIIDNAKVEQDEERVKKAEQAYESIDKAEYKHKDKKIKSDRDQSENREGQKKEK